MADAIVDRLCAANAVHAGLDPIGTSSAISRLLAIEHAPPWTEQMYTPDPDGTLVQRAGVIQRAAYERLVESGEAERIYSTGFPAMNAIAPDPTWSDPMQRIALLITRPPGAFARFEIAEYRFPVDSSDVLDLVRAFYEAPGEHRSADDYSEFDHYRVPHGGQREFFICTHGQVDICCAKFGVPLYRTARAAYPAVRAWRMSHFGGHRYAPTAWEFPAGYMWAYLDADAARRVLQRTDAAEVRATVRGWSGMEKHAQVLDRVGLERFGWDWLDFARTAEVDPIEGDRWRVRVAYASPGGESGVIQGTVRIGRHVTDVGCGTDWGTREYPVPEYEVESVQ